MAKYFHQYPIEMYEEILELLEMTDKVKLELFYEFMYWNYDNTITIGEYYETHRKGFEKFYKNYLRKNYEELQVGNIPFKVLDIHILCFLHELGHFATYTYENDVSGATAKQILKFKYQEGDISYKEYVRLYRKVKIEHLADTWAVETLVKYFTQLVKIQEKYVYGMLLEQYREMF